MEPFLAEVEAFITAHSMSESKFGREALGDHKFVFQLREGRSPSLKIAAKVRNFMMAYPNHDREAA